MCKTIVAVCNLCGKNGEKVIHMCKSSGGTLCIKPFDDINDVLSVIKFNSPVMDITKLVTVEEYNGQCLGKCPSNTVVCLAPGDRLDPETFMLIKKEDEDEDETDMVIV